MKTATLTKIEIDAIKPTAMCDGSKLEGDPLRWRKYLDGLKPNDDGTYTFIPYYDYVLKKG